MKRPLDSETELEDLDDLKGHVGSLTEEVLRLREQLDRIAAGGLEGDVPAVSPTLH